MTPGIYYDISNEDYHQGEGVSKSQLDIVAKEAALLIWNKDAPEDEEKKDALNMGTALHCLLLEPDEFGNRFIEAPPFNRKTNAGKQEEKEFLEQCADIKKKIMDHEQHRKLKLMRESVMAHPGGKKLLEHDGVCEASIYWNDTETGELCRIRPDKLIPDKNIILDVKKVSDINRFPIHVEEFRYHVQDAMYSEGYRQHTNGTIPTFCFLAVSESIDCGKYPVRLFVLDQYDREVGFDLFRRDLNKYHECRTAGNFGLGFEVIQRPEWARRRDE
ncbi:PD-(D/E)XK nuclease-like domain-containing protein [Xenorhabdus bovienii]|uniref:PD-(D/E)XK nuclease-like domain-containing protein n=1 Tax=Xenorhabdus bovienii TaxID=40576 RepID=A0AAJ1JAZ1_XENBV|nr:PD-(D/E)XK nuclease-like domain-containing protein [Xenorhabdus bovienii]MDE1479422.1 PD-(D/E)XK nuclease-like domain-containing protein [Xenorhabdus bovienii]MDE9511073.1 PD-(D/E)XK nuclease-like domain-containing protein [Xenorhabdus bovienii]MDE9519823.1 PD-(D/E)XK nuclease-like domain-containing protein [Xenorhabdus bovienii]MDE9522730.1 PD-(D/E)XK nuclease-like domain-containing protein [Xenorhabdus bovienii]MDE9557676.1 PD-(D/E)XK nuclease-like domain-containing protein [Xenorhabdus b